MLKFSELLAEMQKMPTFVAVRPDEHTARQIEAFQRDHDIPNSHSRSKLHVTLLASRKTCPEPKLRYHQIYKGTFERWEIFDSYTTGKKTNCLVAKIHSVDLALRHKELVKQLDASHDYAQYIPHLTLSYDVGDLDVGSLPPLKGGPLYFSQEYANPLLDF